MRLLRFAPLVLALCLPAALVAPANENPPTGEELLRAVDRNLNPESYESYRKLINVEPDGRRKEYVLFTAKKGDKLIALFLDPPSEKGRATLRLGDNMWLYIPGVGRPLRITSLQSVVGGVFNNADILNLDYGTEYAVERLSVVDEEPYLLELKARTGAVAYDRLRMRIDRETLLPTEIEAYAASGLLIKTLRFKDIKDFGNGIRRPTVMETDSPLYKGYKSVMIFANVGARAFPDEVFTVDYLPRAAELRR